jgi:hypothetical protein
MATQIQFDPSMDRTVPITSGSFTILGTILNVPASASVTCSNMTATASYNGNLSPGTCQSVGPMSPYLWSFSIPALTGWGGKQVQVVVVAYPSDNSAPAIGTKQITLGAYAAQRK